MVDLEAGKPFIGYRLEGLFRFGFRLANLGLANFNRVLTICQRFPRCGSPLASLCEKHFRVGAEGKRFLLTEKPIVYSPQATASRRSQEIVRSHRPIGVG